MKVIQLNGKADFSQFHAKGGFDDDNDEPSMEVEDDFSFELPMDLMNDIPMEPVKEMGDPKMRRQIMSTLDGYRELLGHRLQRHMPMFDQMDSMSEWELQDFLAEVEVVVSQRGSADAIFSTYMTGVQMLEVVAPYASFDLSNLGTVLHNQETKDLISEIYLQNQSLRQTPMKRLMIHTLKSCMIVNAVNKSKVAPKEETSQIDLEKDIDVAIEQTLNVDSEDVPHIESIEYYESDGELTDDTMELVDNDMEVV